MPYVTKKEIERARQPDLLTFLQRYNPDDLVPTRNGAYRLKSHDSLKISNGKWCWWSHGKMGGVNALEYLIKVENRAFPEAVQLINGQCGFFHAPRPAATKPAAPHKKADFLLPVHSQSNKRITAYLLSRGIDMEVLDFCYQRGLLYEEANYHNAVFVGYDAATPKYAALRGATTGNRFMGEVAGSDKAYCFAIPAETGGTTLHVFECAIDALSYLTQLKMSGQDWRSQSVLSLGGVYPPKQDTPPEVPIALKTYLPIHREVQEIVLRLDNDPVGRSAAEAIRISIETLTVTIEHPAQGKDYNEWLMLQKGFSTEQSAPPKAKSEPER